MSPAPSRTGVLSSAMADAIVLAANNTSTATAVFPGQNASSTASGRIYQEGRERVGEGGWSNEDGGI